MAKKAITEATDFDHLSSIWILASNDEHHLISYEGIRYRLNLPRDFDVRGKIKTRPEMFRHGVRQSLVDAWKERMRENKSLPSWIRDIEDTQERDATIDDLSVEDVFRSQFRTQPDAPQSKIETIEWGLGHLERLRKAEIEAGESKTKKLTAMWPLLTIAVSIAALISTIVLSNRTMEIQKSSLDTQVALKKYETSFRPKMDAYLAYMQVQREVLDSADTHNTRATERALAKLAAVSPSVYLFMTDDNSKRELIRHSVTLVTQCKRFAANKGDVRFECFDAAGIAATVIGNALFPADPPK